MAKTFKKVKILLCNILTFLPNNRFLKNDIFARASLGYFNRSINPERSISVFNSLLAKPDLPKNYKLAGLQYLVNAYGEGKDRAGRANATSQWQEVFEGYLVTPYMQRVAKKMERMAN